MNLKQLLFGRGYHLGFIDEAIGDIVYSDKKYTNANWVNLNGYRRSWFADPFVLKSEGEYLEVLAEEFEYSKNKGRLSHLLIKKKNLKLEKVTPILELDTHLSFPAFIKHDGKIYVYPENYVSGAVSIYEFDQSNMKLVNPRVLLKEELVDAQLLELDGAYYLMGVKHEDDGYKYNYTKVLHIYKSNSLFGEYIPYQEIKSGRREERGAGLLFSLKDKLIRPAQSCEGGYGKGIVFYEFVRNKDGYFTEKEVGRMAPGKNKYPFVLHTFNKNGQFQIIDGMGFENNLLRPILNKIFFLLH